jgi:hypothetical protein
MWRRGMHIGFGWETHKETGNLEDLDVGGKIVLKCILEK